MDRQMAPTSQGFDQGGIFSRDWFSERLDKAQEKKKVIFTVFFATLKNNFISSQIYSLHKPPWSFTPNYEV